MNVDISWPMNMLTPIGISVTLRGGGGGARGGGIKLLMGVAVTRIAIPYSRH